MPGPVDFQWLAGVDLVVEQVFRGGTRGTVGDDPLSRLLPVGNQGGFRYKGSPSRGDVRLVVLYTSGHNIDWPDELDVTTGTFTYYGDNRNPGRELHDTQRRGNLILRDAFANAAGGADERALVPIAPPTTQHRTRAEQLPADAEGMGLLNTIWSYFRDNPVRFERCAVELFRFSVPGLESVDLTRPTRDGGRDALGQLALGPVADPIRLEFSLEAKCYAPGNPVGVRKMSRLISRIKHREFGVMVTTSYVHEQAYREIREDGHPIAVFSGADIVNTLRAVGITTIPTLRAWLTQEFPITPVSPTTIQGQDVGLRSRSPAR